MNELDQVRDAFVDYVRSQLVGPFGGTDEVIADPPNRRYLMGILFPRQVETETFFESEGEEIEEGGDEAGAGKADNVEDRFSDTSVQSANDFLPSSIGLSFFTDAPSVAVTASAAYYETLTGSAATTDPEGDSSKRNGPKRAWRRRELSLAEQDFTTSGTEPIWAGRGEIHVRWRKLSRGSLVTVSLVNGVESEPEQVASLWSDMLLQAEFHVRVPAGFRILEYPSPELASRDPEEAELRMLYRDRRIYAVGHGCSAQWSDESPVTGLSTEVMPAVHVPRIAAAGADSEALKIANLGFDGLSDTELLRHLTDFVEAYREWIRTQRNQATQLNPGMQGAADAVLERLDEACDRMQAGVDTLDQHPAALLAFRAANEAMLRQMVHSSPDLAGSRHPRSSRVVLPTEYHSANRWRPFQLAFVLTSLAGLVEPTRDDRDLVDLIWFPTGGGKTEAYLLLAAFEIMHRRLVFGAEGGGTSVLSRYTLSLLTAQQFQRTATTICALETIRRQRPSDFGDEHISIGLWVGEATTPNRFSTASQLFIDIRDEPNPRDVFLLERCPWCGTEILPRTITDDDADYGVSATDSSFRFFCPNDLCEFHDRLWVHVVDDDLYERPPTFLLGTVDKFASLAWEPRSGVFFGNGSGGVEKRRPSLIIQDELHLLTGPLGTIAGVYEAAIELLCEQDGRLPKVVASTATIRRAGAQVSGLFGREVRLFPPPGLRADSSFFAEVDKEAPSRLYVGLMAQGHTSDTATVQTCTALLQAPIDLALEGDALDAYYTLVAYHNSLRELGRTVTMALDDIPARIKTLMAGRPLREYDVEELTSNVPRAEHPRLLERLGLRYNDPEHIGMVASTNMLSVGVDVPRLGLMLMNGQPKANAEYIQATSRVGRSSTPGLIFTMFRPTRPRDRSHYENFKPFHEALYRYVEPTTVTPYSGPSRERSLHAALVILARHRLGLVRDDQAGEILNQRADVEDLAARLLDVVARVEPRESKSAKRDADGFIQTWCDLAEEASNSSKSLYYKPAGKGHYNLIKDFNAKGRGTPTLRSMRNVDKETLVAVLRPPSDKANQK
ncbi:helicase-related protein [Gordonia hongkongensis]|uniref:Helicase C-terminal domain-containing protein n=1 Tax=Gordonia hongkongensis TaxID=1701090 RepID=A0ABT6C127_9ACTN|nr:helicase-related protein [Gordonia hongkongensis]MDF6103645.1 hypothetical protein [Gordonia hongkongensis]